MEMEVGSLVTVFERDDSAKESPFLLGTLKLKKSLTHDKVNKIIEDLWGKFQNSDHGSSSEVVEFILEKRPKLFEEVDSPHSIYLEV